MSRATAICLLLLALLGSTPAVAQVRTSPDTARVAGQIVGRIVDAATSQPIVGVAVQIVDLERAALISNAAGSVHLKEIPPGVYELEFKHIAYGSQRHLVNVPEGMVVDLTVRLSTQPIELDGVMVEAKVRGWDLQRRGYFGRKKRGWGRFFDRSDFERWDLRQTLQEIPGMALVPSGSSSFDYVPVFRQGGRPCVPALFIDNRYVPLRGASINELIATNEVEALEVYRGNSTPAEFIPPIPNMRGICGAIVVWTRFANGG